MTTRCIYCVKPSMESRGAPHILPEAIMPGGPTLPVGTVCDPCNHYFGTNIESAIVRHPIIGLLLQLAGAPGKRGKPRAKLGIYDREFDPDATISFPVPNVRIWRDEDGVRNASFQIGYGTDPHFSMDKFRRGIHHIAFNAYAFRYGAEAALDTQFDAVRTYIRRPSKGERWTFIELTDPLDRITPSLFARFPPIEGRILPRVQILNSGFIVDLLNSGCLQTAKLTPATDPPQGSCQIVGPNWKPPGYESPEPGTHYRVSIV